MSPLTMTVNVSREELINVALLSSLALITGVGWAALRTVLPPQPVAPSVEVFQYSVSHLLLGLLPIMALRSRTIEGRVTSLYLLLGIGVGVLIIPQDLVLNSLLSLTLLIGGLVYFRIFSGSSIPLLIIISGSLLEFYLYAAYVLVTTIISSGQLRLGIVLTLLTILLVAVGRMFYEEYRRETGGRSGGKWRK